MILEFDIIYTMWTSPSVILELDTSYTMIKSVSVIVEYYIIYTLRKSLKDIPGTSEHIFSIERYCYRSFKQL